MSNKDSVAWDRYKRVQKSKSDKNQLKLPLTEAPETTEPGTGQSEPAKSTLEKDRFILGNEHNSTMQRTNPGYVGKRYGRYGRSWSGNKRARVGNNRFSGNRNGNRSGWRNGGTNSSSRGRDNLLLTLGFSEGMSREYILQGRVFYGRINLYSLRETEKAYLAKVYAKPVNGSAVVAEAWVPKSIIVKRSAGWIMNKLNEVLNQGQGQSQSQPQSQSQSQPEALTLEEMVEEVVSQSQSQIKKQSQNKTQPNIQNKSQDQGKESKTPAN